MAVGAFRVAALAATKATYALNAAIMLITKHPIVALLAAAAAAALYFSGALEWAFGKIAGAIAGADQAGRDFLQTFRDIESQRGPERALEAVEARMREIVAAGEDLARTQEGVVEISEELNALATLRLDLLKRIEAQERAAANRAVEGAARVAALEAELAGERQKADKIRLNERHRQEIEQAEERGATEDDLAQMRKAHELERLQLAQRYIDEQFAANQGAADRLHAARLSQIDDERDAQLRSLEYRHQTELRQARERGEQTILLERAQAEEVAALRERFRSEDAERERGQIESLEEMRLRLQHSGVGLQREMLKLERERALAAAAGNEAEIERLKEMFDIRRAMLEAQERDADRVRGAALGAFSGFAARLLGQAGPGSAEERTASATEKTAENTKRIFDAIRSGDMGMAWS